ncbi:hypothetical protein QA597_01385 [Marinilabiliaceae bacterium ANBcel2]|nr:hypothetical protein [Marinilabiliaceae bacterium ANBcel2]
MIWKILLVAIILMGITAFLLALNVIFRKNGKFPSIHVGGNKEMAKRGIGCATSQDREARKNGFTC